MTLDVSTIGSTTEVVALRIAGTAEERLLLLLVDGIEAAAEGKTRVVLDVDQLVIVNATAIRLFVAKLFARVGAERLVLACRRRSGRQVLRRWGGSEVQVVADVEQACGIYAARA